MRKSAFIPLCVSLSLTILAVLASGTAARGSAVAAPPAPSAPVTSRALSAPAGKIAAQVETRLAAIRTGEMTTVIVTLNDQAELRRIPGASRAARQRGVIQALQAKAEASQRQIQALLAVRKAHGKVGQVTPFWVFNGLAVTATEDVIRELAARADVVRITPDEIPIAPTGAEGTIESNVSVVNAPALWNLGVSGQGVVVASMDSGVDVSHPDLSERWRGGANSWFDPYGEHPDTPTDMSGHGTRTTGAMVGGDAGGTSIGVAPGAQWIGVKILDDQGGATATAIHQGFEWLLDPDGDPETADAPQVVNNSWTLAYPGCDLAFELDLQSLRAASILPVFAAGNGGPGPETSYSPANNPSAFAVGATDDADAIYAYSSRGPSNCGEVETIFPELVAPGVDIHTADLHGFYADATGTSLAAPHVAGGLALLLSAYPDLTDTQFHDALTNTGVDLGVPGPDNDFGYGRLDLLAAYEWLADVPPPTPTPTPAQADLSLVKDDTADPVAAGDAVVYAVTVYNAGPDAASAVTMTDILPPQVSFTAASAAGWACRHAEEEVTCTRAGLAIGAAERITITTTPPSGAGVITNTATVTSATLDPNPTDNQDTEQTSITPPPAPEADLSITTLDDPDPVKGGAVLTYTLSITNDGPAPATGLTVTDTLPTGTTLDSAFGDGWSCAPDEAELTCTLPSLDIGAAPKLLLRVTAPASAGVITNTASVTSTTSDTNPANNRNAVPTAVQTRRSYYVYLPLIQK